MNASNVMLSLIEQRLREKITCEMNSLKRHVQSELVGREACIYWNDPLDKEAGPHQIVGQIASAGFDMERNITVTITFEHPKDGTRLSVPRYLCELK